MAADVGFSGQESDVNRACSAFGLDTVNYRAFPNNGPVPVAEPEPVPMASAPLPEAVAAIMPAEPPRAAVVEPLVARFEPAAPIAPPIPPMAAPFALPLGQQSAPAAPQWATAPAAPASYPLAGAQPAGSAYPSASPQSHPGMPGGGFSLLQQALPPVQPNPAPMPAFAMARAPLQPLPPSSVAPQSRPVAPPPANPETFGIAFGAAFNAAFGNAEAGAQGPAGYQRSQT